MRGRRTGPVGPVWGKRKWKYLFSEPISRWSSCSSMTERQSRRFQRGFQSIFRSKIPSVEAIERFKVVGICWIQSSDLTNTKIKIYEAGLKNLDVNMQFCTNKINGSANIIVVSQSVVKDKPNSVLNLLDKYLKPEQCSNKHIVSDEWVQKCIQTAKIDDFSPYIFPMTTVNSFSSVCNTGSIVIGNNEMTDHSATSIGTKRKQAGTPKSNESGKFFCIQSGTIQQPPVYNESLLEQLELCKNASTNNSFQRRNYDKVINLVKKAPIKSFAEFEEIYAKNKSSTISKKVREFFENGTIPKAELVRSNPEDLAVAELKSVWGIGEKTAKDLVRVKKIMNIEELRRRVEADPSILNHSQLIGLKRHEEIIQKIPRMEVEQILEAVRTYAHKLEPNCEVVAGGSYRRGEAICGDVDIIIGPAHGKSFIGIGPQLISDLTKSGFVTDQLTRFGDKHLDFESKKKRDDIEDFNGDSGDDDLEEEHDMNSKQSSRYSFMGLCKLPNGIHRRIDIKTYPRKNFAYAILAFTGSAHFNRSMRLYSRQVKNMQLSDQGLWTLQRDDSGGNEVKVSAFHPKDKRVKGNLIVCQTEEDIFKALDLPYKAPNARSGGAIAADGFHIAMCQDQIDLGDDSNDESEM